MAPRSHIPIPTVRFLERAPDKGEEKRIFSHHRGKRPFLSKYLRKSSQATLHFNEVGLPFLALLVATFTSPEFIPLSQCIAEWMHYRDVIAHRYKCGWERQLLSARGPFCPFICFFFFFCFFFLVLLWLLLFVCLFHFFFLWGQMRKTPHLI